MPELGEAPLLDAEQFQDFVESVGVEGAAEEQGKIHCECSPRPCGGEWHPPPDRGQWAEEFADLTSADTDAMEGQAREGYRQDFWKSLEEEWKEAADADHPWLNDYKAAYEPFQHYAFREDNPLEDTEDPLEEGKRRLEAVGGEPAQDVPKHSNFLPVIFL